MSRSSPSAAETLRQSGELGKMARLASIEERSLPAAMSVNGKRRNTSAAITVMATSRTPFVSVMADTLLFAIILRELGSQSNARGVADRDHARTAPPTATPHGRISIGI
jgi:hypothetical protein